MLEVNTILRDRYKIIETIAKGGMGAIYKAYDINLNVQVAVKENLLSTEEFSRQFRREATILASLRHPNLPRVTDHFSIPGQGQYLVMDFIEGEDLRSRLQHEGKMSEQQVIRIGVEICNALDYLHQHKPPILHRDIKPGNIKITPFGQIYLVDFGLAKTVEENAVTTTGAQSLTPGFSPPEQYGQGTTFRSDLYALGATLYAALTGKIPEDGINRALGAEQLTPIRKHRPGISPIVAAAIEKSMEVDPLLRYGSAQLFSHALQNENPQTIKGLHYGGLNNFTNVTSEFHEEIPKKHKGVRKKQLSTGLMIFIGLIIIGTFSLLIINSIIGLIDRNKLPHVQSTDSQLELQSTSGTLIPSEIIQTTNPITSNSAQASPNAQPTPLGGSQTTIAFVSLVNGIPQIFTMNPANFERRQLTSMVDGACQPDLNSPTNRIVFIAPCQINDSDHDRSAMWIMNLDGSQLTPLRTIPGGDFDPDWFPDGTRILFSSNRDGLTHLYEYQLEGNSITRLTSRASYDHSPAWSPDGTQIAFVSNRNGTMQIFTMNSDGTNIQEFTLLALGVSSNPTWSPDGQVIAFNLGSQNPVIAARSINAGSQVMSLNDDLVPALDPVYSPDSYWILFEQNGQLILITANGSNAQVISPEGSNDYDPDWTSLNISLQIP